jgi:hypothetical protein
MSARREVYQRRLLVCATKKNSTHAGTWFYSALHRITPVALTAGPPMRALPHRSVDSSCSIKISLSSHLITSAKDRRNANFRCAEIAEIFASTPGCPHVQPDKILRTTCLLTPPRHALMARTARDVGPELQTSAASATSLNTALA